MKENNRAESIRHTDVAFEPRDANPRSLFLIGIAILVAAFIIHSGVLFLFDYFAARDRRAQLQPSTTVRSSQVKQPPEPQLQVNPEQDLEELHRSQTDKLRGYDWVDQKTGTVRIPIERAMNLLVQRGLPQVQQTQGAGANQAINSNASQAQEQGVSMGSASGRNAVGKKQQ